MRLVYIALIVVFTGLVVLFKFQNLQAVTISLFGMSVTLPAALLVFLIYLLGMFTGGCLLALLRTWIRGAMRKTA
ncbi:MAG: DUF1049 domain-containing protein [Burkholderiales bacterium]